MPYCCYLAFWYVWSAVNVISRVCNSLNRCKTDYFEHVFAEWVCQRKIKLGNTQCEHDYFLYFTDVCPSFDCLCFIHICFNTTPLEGTSHTFAHVHLTTRKIIRMNSFYFQITLQKRDKLYFAFFFHFTKFDKIVSWHHGCLELVLIFSFRLDLSRLTSSVCFDVPLDTFKPSLKRNQSTKLKIENLTFARRHDFL